jgi:toxin ParE1/3/4
MRIRWARAARNDVSGIRRYIAQDSPFYAKQFCERLVAAVDTLAEHPRIGREVPEAEGNSEEVRELIFRAYRILYLVEADTVHILTVVHGARNLEGMASKPWA